MEKRIKDILTDDELLEVNRLHKKIMDATTKTEINHYKYEIDQIFKKAKERYFRFSNVVEKHINYWDPMELLSLGAPDDEYEVEIQRIADALPQIRAESDLALKIKEVFDHAFDGDFNYAKCLYIAQVIWRDFSNKTC
ncbi:DUF1871 family protein [Siminovitchia terrae]|uniref:DUF1871 family protein n=1 Tax=Siminovitchia terrae TaxID=1914933 RepID=UPI0028B144D9|nr:DUF1871 family protein [Siminovitchia terrae]